MHQTRVDGRMIAYHEAGSGDPVVLLHPGFVADGMVPLLDRPELSAYRLIAPHRRGFGHSDPAQPPVSIHELAADVVGLLDRLGIERAHLVGHSLGANVALETARIGSQRIASVTLLEPPLGFCLSTDATAYLMSIIGKAMQQFAAGDHEGAVSTWLDGAFGPAWQDTIERAVPGAVAQATKDAPAAFTLEAAALQSWPFGPEQLRDARTPMLSVVHPNPSWPGFNQVHEALVEAGAEALEVPLPSHLLQLLDPEPVARGVARFLTRHPLAVTA
jgi:pimeloyl-ACP methyl ester carboxylesterase